MSDERHETVSDNVSVKHQFREVAKMMPHEEVDVSKMETTTPTREESSAVGNASKMREALEKFNVVDLSGLEFPLDGDSSTIYNSNKKEITIPYCRIAELLNGVKAAQDMAKAALSAPPRNCDVGTAEEQSDRFDKFCYSHSKCHKCPVKSIWNSQHRQKQLCEIIRCEIIWSQMQYEEVK